MIQTDRQRDTIYRLEAYLTFVHHDMSYLFTCPHCQTKTLVDDQYSGHVGRCVTCDQRIELPNFAAATVTTNRESAAATGKTLSPMMRRFIAATLCVVALAGLVGVAYRYGSPAIANLATGRERAVAVRNLEQIADALNAYAADYGVYPLPIVRDSNGKAMHSWRVAILPYLNEQQLYNSYDFKEPWDSPKNQMIVQSMPAVYAKAVQNNWVGFQCQYQLVTGERTLFPKSGPLGPKQVLDDPTKTALVVEAMTKMNLMSVWTEPSELEIQAMTGMIGSNPGIEIGSVTEGGAAIATVDGHGHFFKESTAPEIVRAILTSSGGEPLSDDVLD